ncbi:MAG: hypothetical protein U0641_20210 [Anaerolineae bacterium]
MKKIMFTETMRPGACARAGSAHRLPDDRAHDVGCARHGEGGEGQPEVARQAEHNRRQPVDSTDTRSTGPDGESGCTKDMTTLATTAPSAVAE